MRRILIKYILLKLFGYRINWMRLERGYLIDSTSSLSWIILSTHVGLNTSPWYLNIFCSWNLFKLFILLFVFIIWISSFDFFDWRIDPLTCLWKYSRIGKMNLRLIAISWSQSIALSGVRFVCQWFRSFFFLWIVSQFLCFSDSK